jgi:hypothetical protein
LLSSSTLPLLCKQTCEQFHSMRQLRVYLRDGLGLMRRLYATFCLVIFHSLLLAAAANAAPAEQEMPQIGLTAERPVFCGSDGASVLINLNGVAGLYGYQFEVVYDPNLVSAGGTFVDTFFDTANPEQSRTPWKADCASTPGICRFSASKVAPGEPVTGSGPIAAINFTGLRAGEFDVAIANSFLSDRDANAIAHSAAPLHLTVCGITSISGRVRLQGRAMPIDSGEISLTDLDGRFGPYTAAFSAADGSYTVAGVKVMPGGSSYQIEARHSLYLSNRMAGPLEPDRAYVDVDTRLRGGDANNNGAIDIEDLACIGGAFGGAPAPCGSNGSSDINADGTVNIFDLVLAGGNYPLSSPQPW